MDGKSERPGKAHRFFGKVEGSFNCTVYYCGAIKIFLKA